MRQIDFANDESSRPVRIVSISHTEYPNLTLKYVLSSFANRPPVRRIDFPDDEWCRPVRIVSIRQHLMPLFNALGRKKINFNIYNILTM